jgi:RHH-type proline utilization regulon transcriptional repressor/proline dehydrogenase/delta 1-pyrroline-5-carboxylate dehydrogenase
VRERARESGRAGLVQGLLQEFALSSSEGVALMCLAEALLRIPDARPATPDPRQDRERRLALAPRPEPVAVRQRRDLGPAAHRQAGRDAQRRRPRRGAPARGRPRRRAADPRGVDMAMRLMGEQFVTGETIEQALANAGRARPRASATRTTCSARRR